MKCQMVRLPKYFFCPLNTNDEKLLLCHLFFALKTKSQFQKYNPMDFAVLIFGDEESETKAKWRFDRCKKSLIQKGLIEVKKEFCKESGKPSANFIRLSTPVVGVNVYE